MYNRPVERWCGQVITHKTITADIFRTYALLNDLAISWEYPLIDKGEFKGELSWFIKVGDLLSVRLGMRDLRYRCLDGTLYDYLKKLIREVRNDQ